MGITIGEMLKNSPTDADFVINWHKEGVSIERIRKRLMTYHDLEDDYIVPSLEDIKNIIKHSSKRP